MASRRGRLLFSIPFSASVPPSPPPSFQRLGDGPFASQVRLLFPSRFHVCSFPRLRFLQTLAMARSLRGRLSFFHPSFHAYVPPSPPPSFNAAMARSLRRFVFIFFIPFSRLFFPSPRHFLQTRPCPLASGRIHFLLSSPLRFCSSPRRRHSSSRWALARSRPRLVGR